MLQFTSPATAAPASRLADRMRAFARVTVARAHARAALARWRHQREYDRAAGHADSWAVVLDALRASADADAACAALGLVPVLREPAPTAR